MTHSGHGPYSLLAMSNFRNLIVWQMAHDLALRCERAAARFARKKRTLAEQLEEAAHSVPAAIAEGRGHGTDADFASYVSVAIGSVSEVESHLQRVYDRGLLPMSEYEELTTLAIETRKKLIGLRRTLRGQPRQPWLRPAPKPGPAGQPGPPP